MAEFTYIDLFAGCGGFSLGLREAGLRGVWAIELDEDATATYRTNIGDHILCGDIRKIDTKTVPHPDLLVGGFPFPLPAFSMASQEETATSSINAYVSSRTCLLQYLS